ncbi:MAG TPA: hypothetical protein VNJ70_03600 [Thermoanaerobaculia bacterium]|nr:hypothetical protein [Thermoanaerobaculia bacterium]
MLQFFEELLLAETVWIADTEGTRTLSGTYRVLDALQNAGLAKSTNSGLVRIAFFLPESFRRVIETAASSLSNHLVLQGTPATLEGHLRERGLVDAGPLRPAGVLPIDFHALIKKIGRWSSSNREAVLQQAIVDREFNSTVSPFLVSEALFAWLASCVAMAPQPSDPIYTHLVTLARLSINRSLAASISDDMGSEDSSRVLYAPAHARAKALAANYLPADAAAVYFLRNKLAALYGEAHSQRSRADIPYSAAFPMPVLGAWLMLSLPRDATLPDYLAEIAQQREAPQLVAFRRWLSGDPTPEEVDILVSKVQRRLKVPRRSPSKMTVWAELSVTRRPNVGVKTEREVTGAASLPLRQWVRSLRTGGTVALLTGCLEVLLQDKSLADDLVARTQRLIRPSRRGLTHGVQRTAPRAAAEPER